MALQKRHSKPTLPEVAADLCSAAETRGLDFQKVGGLALAEKKTHLSCHDSTHIERFRSHYLASWPYLYHLIYQLPVTIPSSSKSSLFCDLPMKVKMPYWLMLLLLQTSPTFGPQEAKDNPFPSASASLIKNTE